MVDSCVLNKIQRRCGFENEICLSSNGNSWGVGFWWRDLKVAIVSYSLHHVAVDVLNKDNIPMWRAVGIYGWPEGGNKYRTWELMSNLKSNCHTPCIMFGDFNEIVSLRGKKGGAPRSERLMYAFREVIDSCGFHDLGFKGSIFTCARKTGQILSR